MTVGVDLCIPPDPRKTSAARAAVKGAKRRDPEGVDGRERGASIAGGRGVLPTDPQASLDAPSPLPGLKLKLKAKPSLGLDKPSLGRLANRSRYCVLRLAAEGVAGVLHAMFLAVTLNAPNAAIPSLAFAG